MSFMAVLHGSSLRTPMSLEDFERLGETHHHEWYDGLCIVNPPARQHVIVAERCGDLLKAACPVGFRLYREWGWRLRDAILEPDLMLAPIDADPDLLREAPLLIVEVLSPSTRDQDLGRKRELYSAGGLLCYWVVDPESGAVHVYGGPGLELVQTIVDAPTITVGAVAVLIDPPELAAP